MDASKIIADERVLALYALEFAGDTEKTAVLLAFALALLRAERAGTQPPTVAELDAALGLTPPPDDDAFPRNRSKPETL